MPLVYRALSEQQIVDLAKQIATNQHKPNLSIEVDIQRLLAANLTAIKTAEEEKRILQALRLLAEDRQQTQAIVLNESAKTYFTDKQIDGIWKATPASKRNARDLLIPSQYFRQKPLKERAPAVLIRVLGTVGYLGTPRLICDDDEGNNRRLTITARRKPLSDPTPQAWVFCPSILLTSKPRYGTLLPQQSQQQGPLAKAVERPDCYREGQRFDTIQHNMGL